jgi:hypothetical protein
VNARLTSPVLRAGLWFLTFVEVAVGLVATLAPGYLLFAIPHLIFHVTRLAHFTTVAAVGQTTTLVIALLPAALLMLTGRRSNTPK